MPTVIDSLVVELGLDPAKFTKGQKDAAAAFLKTKEEALKTGKDIEDSGGKAGEALIKLGEEAAKLAGVFAKLTNAVVDTGKKAEESTKKSGDGIEDLAKKALALFAVFLGVTGLKDFAANLVTSDSALGRLALNLGVSTQTASVWGLAAERLGGSAAATTASIQGLADKLYALKTLGQNLPDAFWIGLARGGVVLDRTRDVYSQQLQIAQAIQGIQAREGRPAAYQAGRTLFGLDEGTINLILDAGPRLKEVLDSLRPIALTPEQAKVMQEWQRSWAAFSQQVTSVGRDIFVAISEPLQRLIAQMSAWLAKSENIERIKTIAVEAFNAIKAALESLAAWLAGGGGQQMLTFLQNFGHDLAYVVRNIVEAINAFATLDSNLRAFQTNNRWSRLFGIGVEPKLAGEQAIAGATAGAGEPATPGWFGRRWQDVRRQFGYEEETSPAQPGSSVAGGGILGGATAVVISLPSAVPARAAGAPGRFDFSRLLNPTSIGDSEARNANDTLTRQIALATSGRYGAELSASQSSVVSNYANTSSEMNIHGPITVNTMATDAHGLAADLIPALKGASYAAAANAGPQ